MNNIREENIKISEALYIIWSNKIIVMSVMLLFGMAAVLYNISRPQQYNVSASLEIAGDSFFQRYSNLNSQISLVSRNLLEIDNSVDSNFLPTMITRKKVSTLFFNHLQTIKEATNNPEDFKISRKIQDGKQVLTLDTISSDASSSTKKIEKFISTAISLSKQELIRELEETISTIQMNHNVAFKIVEEKLDLLAFQAEAKRASRIIFLNEQLAIAELISKQRKLGDLDKSLLESNAYYLRGSEALQIEIQIEKEKDIQNIIESLTDYIELSSVREQLSGTTNLSELNRLMENFKTDKISQTNWLEVTLGPTIVVKNSFSSKIIILSLVLGGLIGTVVAFAKEG